MRILTFTSLYPNSVFPENGVFVEARLRQLLGRKPAYEARVVAPVPWFPFRGPRFGLYGRMAAVPGREVLKGISIEHPRYVVVPKLSWMVTPITMAAQSYPTLRKLIAEGYDFDLIDAHYLFPDGVAAASLARAFRKPFVITARGSDVRVLTKYSLARRQILSTIHRAAQVITVSAALRDDLIALGADGDRIRVLRNGVDLSMFSPGDRVACRTAIGLSGKPVVASVGRLVDLKGHDLVIRAILNVPDATLVIVGSGPEERRLKALAQDLGVAQRVRFLGQVGQDRLRDVYTAADVLVLASTHEGWPNVLLEAMACGCPVVVTDIDGMREVVQSSDGGILVESRTPEALGSGITSMLDRPPGRERTRRYAEAFSWDTTSDGQSEVFERIASSGFVNASGIVRC